MIRVCSSAGIREIDRRTIQEQGVPSLVLMEAAGRAVAAELLHRAPAGPITVLAGKGNNGGDGWVIARLLHLCGREVRVWGLPAETSDAQTMRAAALGVGVQETEGIGPAACVVDALLGTGIKEEVRGEIRLRIQAMAASGLPVFAVDIPSGLCGDTGRVLGACAPAVVTVTFGHPRIGQLLEPGAELCGELVVADIGLMRPAESVGRMLEGRDVAALLPPRAAGAHKASAGRLGVVAGSVSKAGAAVLACLGALEAGCGLVTLFTRPEVVPRLAALPPEVMISFDEPSGDALVVGPGLEGEEARVLALWERFPGPAVFDASGLLAFAASPFVRAITPHPGEAARLLGWSSAQVQADRAGALRALATIAPTLLKGRNTLISGDLITVNPTGGPVLATGGSGDVLAGVVGAFLARGLPAVEALSAAAWIHGLAGDLLGAGPALASDVARTIPRALAAAPEHTLRMTQRPLI